MSAEKAKPEVWLRGPVPGIPAPLQPVAHSLLQAMEDVQRLADSLSAEDVWTSIGGAATIGFHVRHMARSLDRLFTYARGEPLTEQQRALLAAEKTPDPNVTAADLIAELRIAVDRALEQLAATSASELDEERKVGRAGLPSTVRGLLYHAGEHATRHAGQISTTVRILTGLRGG